MRFCTLFVLNLKAKIADAIFRSTTFVSFTLLEPSQFNMKRLIDLLYIDFDLNLEAQHKCVRSNCGILRTSLNLNVSLEPKQLQTNWRD